MSNLRNTTRSAPRSVLKPIWTCTGNEAPFRWEQDKAFMSPIVKIAVVAAIFLALIITFGICSLLTELILGISQPVLGREYQFFEVWTHQSMWNAAGLIVLFCGLIAVSFLIPRQLIWFEFDDDAKALRYAQWNYFLRCSVKQIDFQRLEVIRIYTNGSGANEGAFLLTEKSRSGKIREHIFGYAIPIPQLETQIAALAPYIQTRPPLIID